MKKEKNQFEQELRVWMQVWDVLNRNGYELLPTLDEDGDPAFDLVKVTK